MKYVKQPPRQRRKQVVRPNLSNFIPVPPYYISLRFTCEPATDCSTLTGLSAKNFGLAVGVAFLNRVAYDIPPNGVLAPTAVAAIPFKYMKIKRAHLWGPTSGAAGIVLNADASTLIYPKPTRVSDSASVTNRPYQCLTHKKPFPLVLNTTTSNISEVYLVTFEKSAIGGGDNTVIFQIDCVVFS